MNGRKFEPWLAACYFRKEKLEDTTTKTETIIKETEKLVIPEDSAKLMSVDAFKKVFERLDIDL